MSGFTKVKKEVFDTFIAEYEGTLTPAINHSCVPQEVMYIDLNISDGDAQVKAKRANDLYEGKHYYIQDTI
jgi:hypothetical protein